MPKAKKIEKVEEVKEAPKATGVLESMVDSQKAVRAEAAVNGKAKSDSAELTLLGRAKAEGVSGHDEQVLYIYKGLWGLVDLAKAQVNSANEAKAAKRKARA